MFEEYAAGGHGERTFENAPRTGQKIRRDQTGSGQALPKPQQEHWYEKGFKNAHENMVSRRERKEKPCVFGYGGA